MAAPSQLLATLAFLGTRETYGRARCAVAVRVRIGMAGLMIVGGVGPSACTQHLLQRDGADASFEVAQRFIGQVRESDHAILRQKG
jgi:hypothetical protein